jgi:exodeoxyribonuclease-5
MTAHDRGLSDVAQRALAIAAHDRSMLVEAGAGSGKTAVLSGRIAMMLASGTPPGAVAAVSFTELAASELLERIGDVIARLLRGDVPEELKPVLPHGLTAGQEKSLRHAEAHLDELVCTTIHGFCQRLVKPYPVEADMDPGARIADEAEADRLFRDILDGWLRESLSDGRGLLTEMFMADPRHALEAVERVADCLRAGRTVGTHPSDAPDRLAEHFADRVAAFSAFVAATDAVEADTVAAVEAFRAMSAGTPPPGTVGDAELVGVLMAKPDPRLCKADGDFASYKGGKGKWTAAAKLSGLSKDEAVHLHDAAKALYGECCKAWADMRANAASELLVRLVPQVRIVLARYQERKRAGALLDFDDLIEAAVALLRGHEAVRRALGDRHRHVLVDEFQDTDPQQAELFWLLCGERPDHAASDEWTDRVLRPGALFLVGDPKQAIYRFRGADISTYVRARDCILAHAPEDVVSIATNFRSCRSILTFVDERFQDILAGPGQPGFASLSAFHEDHGRGPCVAALDVPAALDGAKRNADALRDAEAEAVADLCARLIGRQLVACKTHGTRVLTAGDIALLAPSGSDLWRYEEALEARGVPVATQAGKGFFRRQEVQDLIALTRVLADPRDTLALGAFLRGPTVGLTDEELLDIVHGLPRDPERPEALPALRLGLDAAHVRHPVAKPIFERLQALARQALGTTPHDILSRAVDAVMLRPVVMHRHEGHAERALANVDLYLEMSRPYAVRGLRAFARAMQAAWDGRTRTVEGRPDAQAEAVSLFTMHASKGLEWPVVIPVNTATRTKSVSGALIDRAAKCMYCPVFGVRPAGYEKALEAERREVGNERVRLWYVAATRARETLVLPRFPEPCDDLAWAAVVQLGLDELEAVDVSHLLVPTAGLRRVDRNGQTREIFAAEAAAVAAHRRLNWITPSRSEDACLPEERSHDSTIMPDGGATLPRGGRGRGVVLHKLLEEILTGETDERNGLATRALVLIEQLGLTNDEVDPTEVASCAVEALALPEISALRDRLTPEVPVFAWSEEQDEDRPTAGVVDAMTCTDDGRPDVVVDWKSDVAPTEAAIAEYRAQVGCYLSATGARVGFIVFATVGKVVCVANLEVQRMS